MTLTPQRLTITEHRDGIQASLTYSYEGKLPRSPERKKAMAAMVRRVLESLETGKVEEIGFAENGKRLTRRDDMLVTSVKEET